MLFGYNIYMIEGESKVCLLLSLLQLYLSLAKYFCSILMKRIFYNSSVVNARTLGSADTGWMEY